MMDKNFCHFGPVFCLFTPLTTQKIKIWKKWKKHLEIYHFTHGYHKWKSYDVQFPRYGACDGQNFLLFWTVICPFTPLTQLKKSKFWKTEKNTTRHHHFTQVYQKSWSLYCYIVAILLLLHSCYTAAILL